MRNMPKVVGALLCLLLCGGGCKGDSISRNKAPPTVSGDGSATKAADPPSDSKVTPARVRLRIGFGGKHANLSIPETMPAVVGEEAWSKRIAVVATRPSANEIALHFAIAPEAEALELTNQQVLDRATIVRKLNIDKPILLMDSQDLPAELYGNAAPTEMSIEWLHSNG